MSWAIGILGAIIGIAISVHGCTITQSKESSDRYAAFRTAVLTEEKSWKDLYDEYLKTFEKEQLENAPLRQKKLFALQAIAARDIASFQEFKVKDSEREAAIKRVALTRSALLNALSDNRTSDPETADALRRRTFTAEQSIAAKATGAAAPAAGPGVAPAIETLSSDTPKGWAVDVFWCAQADHAAARALGTALASFANAGRPIAAGVTLGQVEVRSANAATWAATELEPGRYVVRDNGDGEEQAARAILDLVNDPSSNAQRFSRGLSHGKPTPWYISVWICPPPIATAA